MEGLNDFLEYARNQGVDDALVIKPSHVFTAPWVRMKCQFGCRGYGRSLCCPPFTPTPEKTEAILGSYNTAILLHSHWKKGYDTVARFNDLVVDLERKLFLAGHYKAWGLGSGPCTRCPECNTSAPCAHGEKARPSMEACGIDVFRTARQQGLPIEVLANHKAKRNLYGLILAE